MKVPLNPLLEKYISGLAAENKNLRLALTSLLEWAEQFRVGDSSLGPEEWYVNRDFCRLVLKESSNER